MRLPLLLTLTAVGLSFSSVRGQVQTFPYEAVVIRDNVLVRSGGSEEYYPTMKLPRDTVVTVKRHDPGGWYMIAPPEKSFNWIPARYVERTAPDTGTIREDHVIAWVGSEFGDEIGVWQGRLSAGTPVTILGERELDTPAGKQRMYRIAPPARDHRWIPGDAVVPVDEAHRQQHDQDPFATPSAVLQQQAETPDPSTAEVAETGPGRRLKRLQAIRQAQRQLAEIDRRFREMIRRTPDQWDLESLEQAYTELQKSTTWRPVAGQIDLRFPAIERYRRRQARYEAFRRLTEATERRDAELLARRLDSSEGGLPENSEAAAHSPDLQHDLPLNVASAEPAAQFDGPLAAPDSGTLSEPQTDPAPTADTPAMTTPFIPPHSRYVGAGIVQRLPEGGYVLTAPDGRRLARIKGTESVMLDEFVGKAVGLHGQRWYREDLKSDFIEVTGLEPVRLER